MLHRLERHRHNLEHARWRVEFLLSLLDSHRHMVTRRDASWEESELTYLRELAFAQAELERLEGYEQLKWREDPPAALRPAS